MTTDQLNRVDSQVVPSLEGESGLKPAGKPLSHPYSKPRCGTKNARDIFSCKLVAHANVVEI